ncbi:MAG: hypothetical protein AAGB02_07880 [Pseudomonadota bacterium]
MLRITTFFLCLLLAGAAAGRYKAEGSVVEARKELRRIEAEKVDETHRIQILKAEIAYLENPDRLQKIADARTKLSVTARDQIYSSEQLAASLGGDSERDDEKVHPMSVPSSGALAMAEPSGVRRE